MGGGVLTYFFSHKLGCFNTKAFYPFYRSFRSKVLLPLLTFLWYKETVMVQSNDIEADVL